MSPRRGGFDGWYEPKPRRPGPSAPRAAGKRPFGASWWGRAWVDALEQRARLDPNRLPRGRTYARSGAVGELTLASGEVVADVQGSRKKPYSVRVRVRTFDEPEWDRVLDALAAEIGHAAALLDGEMPPAVLDDVRAVGLDLLPGAGEVQPRCSCPDWADPCKHAAAVCYLVADELDRDPFGVLLLRGRDRAEVLAGLRARRGGGATTEPALNAAGPEIDDGVVGREAWSRQPSPLPTPPLPPRQPGRPTVLAADPGAGSGVDGAALRALASDAAARALDLSLGGRSTGLELSKAEDFARRAAAALGEDGKPPGTGPDLAAIAMAAGLPPRDALCHALAWRYGGAAGLAVLLRDWDPPRSSIVVARRLLGDATTLRRNRATLGDTQLRLGHDGRWHPYRKRRGGWTPDGDAFVVTPEEEAGVEDIDDP